MGAVKQRNKTVRPSPFLSSFHHISTVILSTSCRHFYHILLAFYRVGFDWLRWMYGRVYGRVWGRRMYPQPKVA
jgi:hypothetical protein